MHNHHYKKRRRRPFLFPLFFIGMLLLLSAVVMWLWNAILPQLVGANNITYLQAIGLLVLCRILFGGFRFGAPPYQRFGPSNNLREKWAGMSEEDKAKFRSEWGKRCGRRGEPPAEKEKSD